MRSEQDIRELHKQLAEYEKSKQAEYGAKISFADRQEFEFLIKPNLPDMAKQNELVELFFKAHNAGIETGRLQALAWVLGTIDDINESSIKNLTS